MAQDYIIDKWAMAMAHPEVTVSVKLIRCSKCGAFGSSVDGKSSMFFIDHKWVSSGYAHILGIQEEPICPRCMKDALCLNVKLFRWLENDTNLQTIEERKSLQDTIRALRKMGVT